ncbi:MetQ/NlpA family ABC transporter substrate-binding protein [Candidatus Hepatincolaceae symbiont of Richtersius coronifer]
MKIFLFLFLVILASTFTLNANTLTIGATAVPHAEILEFAKPLLKEKGINLKIIVFQDYVLPNKALASKDLDANYFQHIVYLEAQNKEHKYNFISAGVVHIEPLGIYSKKYKKLEDIKSGATIIFSNSVADTGRAISLLQKAGLVILKPGVDPIRTTLEDIATNLKQSKIRNDVSPELLPRLYSSNEADLLIINTNYALEAGINPLKDALILEGSSSPYVNVVAIREKDAGKSNIRILMEVLQSPEVVRFIKDKYQGAIVPTK